ncbi:hypothetical protein F2Q70_00011894 [Brassica cretica]|uniref:Secreted protein n=2 Tax=Brassica cretica TaxID=69181 RepID=A0A3N6RQS6_BRACR|nr:hypothetical protein F2Q68_00004939 [Brassica cretica]KAF2611875.1 hypothetical protein F2Q70_00011894 [Brassica cretica]KAF3543581.1 hypothetical protein DY000_02007431 [Brassica cretica]
MLLLRIFLLCPPPASLHRYRVRVVVLCNVHLISSSFLGPILGSPFNGGASLVVLPPSIRVFRGCISRGWVRNWRRFFLIVLRDELFLEIPGLQPRAVKVFPHFVPTTWSVHPSCSSRPEPPRGVQDCP